MPRKKISFEQLQNLKVEMNEKFKSRRSNSRHVNGNAGFNSAWLRYLQHKHANNRCVVECDTKINDRERYDYQKRCCYSCKKWVNPGVCNMSTDGFYRVRQWFECCENHNFLNRYDKPRKPRKGSQNERI